MVATPEPDASLDVDVTFVIHPTWVLDSEISDRAYRLYGILRSYTGTGKAVAWPRRSVIATRLRCSTDTVDRAMTELEILGAITVDRTARRSDGTQKSNRYLVRSVPAGHQSRTGAARQGRTDAALMAAPVRPHELDPVELDPSELPAVLPIELPPPSPSGRVSPSGQAPATRPGPTRIDHQAADLAYDAIDKGCNYMALRGFARYAVNERDCTPTQFRDIVVTIHQAGRPLTKQTIAQGIDTATRTTAAKERPWVAPSTQYDPEEDLPGFFESRTTR
jgi:hypothetical protein